MINSNLRRRCRDATRQARVSRIGVTNATSTSKEALERRCRVAERSCLMLWLSLAHAQALGSRTCCQERRASKSRIGLVRPGNSMAPIPSKRTPATEVIATTGSLTST
jgi:hypothetical protein